MATIALLHQLKCVTREVEVQAEEEQVFLARQQEALMGLKDPTRSPTTRNQASSGPIVQVKPIPIKACFQCYRCLTYNSIISIIHNINVTNHSITKSNHRCFLLLCRIVLIILFANSVAHHTFITWIWNSTAVNSMWSWTKPYVYYK